MSHRPRRSQLPRAVQLRANLRHCLIDGFAYCVMLGLAEMYLAKFVFALGLGPLAVGLIATVPMVLGAASGIPGAWILRKLNSYSKFVGGMAALQAIMLLPLAAIAMAGPHIMEWARGAGVVWLITASVFACTTLYFCGSLGGGPAWVTVTGHLFPARIRSNYFARRSRILQAGTFGGLLAFGLIAQGVEKLFAASTTLRDSAFDPVLLACGVSFLLAAAARAVSAWHLSRYSEPPQSPRHQRVVRLREFTARFSHGNEGRFILYALAGGFALQIGHPYANPFMLDVLRPTDGLHEWIVRTLGAQAPYTLLLAAVYAGRVCVLPAAGRLAARAGSRRLLWIGGAGLVPLAAFWLLSDHFAFLLLFQCATGMALAVWELGLFLMNYESIAPHERIAMITYYTLSNEAGKTGGSLVGAGLLGWAGKDWGAYALVFLVSASARLVSLGLLARVRNPRLPPPPDRPDIAAAEEGERLTVE